jgi:D-aminopeptidase
MTIRARDLGIPFLGNPGEWNAITDVPGVQVGHTTLISGEGKLVRGEGPVRTGVTAILPRGQHLDPVFAAWFALNGNGEMTGTTWIEESGFMRSPVLITNTHSVGIVHDAALEWIIDHCTEEPDAHQYFFHLPVVGETYDGVLNDINGFHVRRAHVFAAIDGASDGAVAEGGVGGGTGMICHRFKGGIGTASRRFEIGGEQYTLGVLVQANYGSRSLLTIAGAPVGQEITDLLPEIHGMSIRNPGGSIIVVVATDAPVLPHQLKRVARRVPLGIAKVGGLGENSSGDIFLAFSTANRGAGDMGGAEGLKMISNEQIDQVFRAAVHATEEAIVNAMVAGKTMVGINGNTVYGLPHDRVREVMRKYGRLVE